MRDTVYMRGFTPQGDSFYGAPPRMENDIAGLRAPHPDMRGKVFMGLRPMPHLGFFFGKKNPKNPKKPD